MTETPANRKNSPLSRLTEHVDDYQFSPRFGEVGEVTAVGDGIAWVNGLPSAAMDELLWFEDGSQGLVFHLSPSTLGAILLKETPALASGTSVHLSKRQLSIPVDDGLLGRVITPLGDPLDGQDAAQCTQRQLLDTRAPTIYQRDFVKQPLYSGNKIIDTLIPIGKGQRQLIIGDEGLGRSSLAIDAVISQKNHHTRCVYVLIGQRRSAVTSTLRYLREHGAMDYTCVVVSEASALAGEKYIAPFAGCAIAEAWMQQGKDTLIVYDDLTTHAHAYRELSLLLRRPPGREAYPGDIFFLHARLLERATHLNAEFGGGSMTALPIVETQQGEISAYIPTNLISITDGQIYLDAQLFNSGFRPAIDISKSVSRIGGKGQSAAIKEEAGRTKLDYLQFLELEVFTRFGARLEAGMEQILKRGQILRKLLIQHRLEPVSPTFNLAWLIAFNEHWFDELSMDTSVDTLNSLRDHVKTLNLTLDSPRQNWVVALRPWYQEQLPQSASCNVNDPGSVL
ncbi:F0F1 ATP synthase subunit alpha [Aestuariicella hydrocarbonica]|uniref:ATP synthase subunit alpha n=1 Tax=Pseudomaricurvus hydrocarbonicus TaxID=1470433 RepID=A0A9E5T2H0_9GAMM|nr:F0F1 ATP synthase subunit alpha [Aestuariicella hydrocarbonica]NHO67831.1 F0F1 ATP synthase subunit alpha [Aestuariicella hydrocarbonica]